MTTRHEALAEIALQDRMDQHGQAVTYRDQHGNETDLTAILGPVTSDEEQHDTGRRIEKRRFAVVSLDTTAASGGVAEPTEKATVCIGSEEWAVEGIQHQTDIMATLKLRRSLSSERTRRDYRGVVR